MLFHLVGVWWLAVQTYLSTCCCLTNGWSKMQWNTQGLKLVQFRLNTLQTTMCMPNFFFAWLWSLTTMLRARNGVMIKRTTKLGNLSCCSSTAPTFVLSLVASLRLSLCLSSSEERRRRRFSSSCDLLSPSVSRSWRWIGWLNNSLAKCFYRMSVLITFRKCRQILSMSDLSN